ncbi:hypothetical protein AX17_006056 [Amanita inopinata Kibby_2008]|nr:hypothetical protein AX17_006056 [Amanita inopinata Kibby_2008]
MLLISKFAVFATLSALFTAASAQDVFAITAPSPDVWWGRMSWPGNAKSPPFSSSPSSSPTRQDPSVLSGRLAFIAQQANADCSKTIDKTQINQAPATGYKLQFADIINGSHIYAESGEFEIKPLGSAYPSSTPSVATPTGNSSAPASTAKSNNGASAFKTSTGLGLGLAAVGAVLGFMTA